MNEKLFNDLVEECTAALELSKNEGINARNATKRMIEGLTSVLYRHDKSFDYKRFYQKLTNNPSSRVD